MAQIRQDDGLSNSDIYSGNVTYKSDGTGSAPWFNWGPYFWAGGPNDPRGDGLFWCDGQPLPSPCVGKHDFRWGEPDLQGHPLNGEHIHPAEFGVEKTAGMLFLNWLTDSNNAWVYPWSHKN